MPRLWRAAFASGPGFGLRRIWAKRSLLRGAEGLSRAQIAATVKALTLDYCEAGAYREDAHFVRDLGLD